MGAFGAVIIIAYHPFGHTVADLYDAAGDRARLGAAVRPGPAGGRAAAAAGRLHLERACSNADVEVDRRDFTVRAAIGVAAGRAARPVRPVRRGQDDDPGGHRRPGRAAPRPGGARRPGADLDRSRRRARCPRGSAGSACCARIPACSRTCPCGANLAYGRRRPGRAGAGRDRRACSASAGCWTPCRPGCPAARRTGWRSAACCSRTATRCCSTSRSPAWTRACAAALTDLVAELVAARRCPPCWSRTSSRTRRPSRTGSRSWTAASCCRSARPTRWCCARRRAGSAELVGYLGFVPVRGLPRGRRPGRNSSGPGAGREPTPAGAWC